MTDFYLKEGDLAPSLQATLKDENQDLVDLRNATQVRFHMQEWGADTTTVDAPATVVDDTGGVVKYDWSAGDTDTPGIYRAEFEVTFSGGSVETYPNYTFIEVKITDEIA